MKTNKAGIEIWDLDGNGIRCAVAVDGLGPRHSESYIAIKSLVAALKGKKVPSTINVIATLLSK